MMVKEDMAGEDFVHVKLSPAGERMAGAAGYIQLVRGRCVFTFRAGEPQRVTRAYEWEVILKTMQYEDEAMFELAKAEESD